MRICSRGPLPLSIFYGRPWPQPGEPLFLPDDTDKALAYEKAAAEACPNCLTRHEDWFDDDGRKYDPPLLEAVTRHCEGCAEKSRLSLDLKAETERNTGSNPETAGRALAGLSVVLEPFKPERV